jgi:predicted deacylase
MIKENKIINYTAKNGEEIQFPFYLIEGKESGPKVCITAGIHGCEYSSIIAATKLYKTLNPKEVKGQIKIIPIVNMPGYRNKTMHTCPIDDKNLNGTFPGSESGSYSEQLVFKLFNDFIKGSDYYLDLHGGDLTEEIVPWCFVHKSGNKVVDQRSKELAENYGTDLVFTYLEGSWPDRGTTYSYASENGIPAIMPEQGGIGQVVEQDVIGFMSGLDNVLKFVGCLKGNPTPPKNKINYFSNSPALFLKSEGIFYPRCKPGDQVSEGDELGILEDYLGNKIEVVKAPYSGKIIMLNTSPAVTEKEELLVIAY